MQRNLRQLTHRGTSERRVDAVAVVDWCKAHPTSVGGRLLFRTAAGVDEGQQLSAPAVQLASSERTVREDKSLTPSDTLPTARRSPAMIKLGGRAARLF